VRQIWGNLRQVAVFPRKLVLLATGSFAQPLLVAMALSVALQAFGDHLGLPVLIVVITWPGLSRPSHPSTCGVAPIHRTGQSVPACTATDSYSSCSPNRVTHILEC
jgi:hypothetical protein